MAMNKARTIKKQYLPSTAARQVFTIGRQQGWMFNYLGKAPIPERPIHIKDWLIIPALQDNSEIPPRAMERIQAIYASGYQPAGWVVIHEAPKLLEAPKSIETNKPKLWKYLAVLGGVAALGGLAAAIIPLLGAAAVVDPILVLVTPELDWIEIDRWYI